MSTFDPDAEIQTTEFPTNTESSDGEVTTPPYRVSSSWQGRWRVLAGVILFAISLPLAWTDSADVPQYPSTLIFNFIIDGFGSHQVFVVFSYPITNMLVYTLLGAIVLLGLLACALCWQRSHAALARRAQQILSIWAVLATFLTAILLYLSWQAGADVPEYPNASLWPNIGLGLALLALVVTWNGIRRLAFEWRVTVNDAVSPRTPPAQRWSVGSAMLVGAFVIWTLSYFLLYWVVGSPCIRFLALSASCWPRFKAMDTLAIVLNHLPYQAFQTANFAGMFLLIVVGCMALALVTVWRNGVTQRNTLWLAAALSLPTLLTLLSIIGSVHTLVATPLVISLGLGMPLAFAALILCWIALVVLWREGETTTSQPSVA